MIPKTMMAAALAFGLGAAAHAEDALERVEAAGVLTVGTETAFAPFDFIDAGEHAGITMLVVTHEIGFAASVASRIVFLDNGKILVEGTPAQVFGRPRNPRIDRFLDTCLDRGAATLL